MSDILQTMSTYLDIVKKIPQLYDDEDKKFSVMSIPEIRDNIWLAEKQLRSQLKNYYPDDLTVTPYAAIPVPRYGNEGAGVLHLTDGDGTNVISVLDSVGVYTQVYTLTFSDDNGAFSVSSELSGDQGAGDTSNAFTTDDGFLSIPLSLWDGAFIKDDIIYVKVYNHEGILAHLSSLLTAHLILDSIYTEEVPDASATAERYRRLYNSLIRAIQGGTIFLDSIGILARNIDPIQQDYEIDEFGHDITNYQDDEWSRTITELD